MANSTRRDFLISSAAIGGAAALASCQSTQPAVASRPPGARLRIGVIGCGGKGLSDMRACAKEHDIVALCDVDDGKSKTARKEHPDATYYHDYRELLDKEQLDAVTVSTPDHSHAGPALMAMAKGIHVFVQKPLTHTVAEARLLRDAARKSGVITSMGNQGTCLDGLRSAVECVRAGAIGAVREVHVWTNRPIWPQGLEKPTHIDAIPASLRWDLWLGPAAWRSYAKGRSDTGFKGYCPFQWRGFWDFGTGALGDMACHIANMPFYALNLGDPSWVEAESEGGTDYMAPKSSVIKFRFPERGDREAVDMTWYDGGKRSFPLDLSGEADRSAYRLLAASADLVLETEAPGTLSRLGIDHGDLLAENPSLSLVSPTVAAPPPIRRNGVDPPSRRVSVSLSSKRTPRNTTGAPSQGSSRPPGGFPPEASPAPPANRLNGASGANFLLSPAPPAPSPATRALGATASATMGEPLGWRSTCVVCLDAASHTRHVPSSEEDVTRSPSAEH